MTTEEIEKYLLVANTINDMLMRKEGYVVTFEYIKDIFRTNRIFSVMDKLSKFGNFEYSIDHGREQFRTYSEDYIKKLDEMLQEIMLYDVQQTN